MRIDCNYVLRVVKYHCEHCNYPQCGHCMVLTDFLPLFEVE